MREARRVTEHIPLKYMVVFLFDLFLLLITRISSKSSAKCDAFRSETHLVLPINLKPAVFSSCIAAVRFVHGYALLLMLQRRNKQTEGRTELSVFRSILLSCPCVVAATWITVLQALLKYCSIVQPHLHKKIGKDFPLISAPCSLQ